LGSVFLASALAVLCAAAIAARLLCLKSMERQDFLLRPDQMKSAKQSAGRER
jgi:hypothetical protein